MYRKILVPLDGSQRAEEILPHVVELASKCQSKVTLIRVVQFHIGFEGTESLSTGAGSELAVRAFEEDKISTENYLDEVKAKLHAQGIDTKIRVAFGPVIDEIIQAASQEKVDLIAMASHGRTGAACVFYGCVALASCIALTGHC
jgi:nucleotide-binding universal stress UspA family protein